MFRRDEFEEFVKKQVIAEINSEEGDSLRYPMHRNDKFVVERFDNLTAFELTCYLGEFLDEVKAQEELDGIPS